PHGDHHELARVRTEWLAREPRAQSRGRLHAVEAERTRAVLESGRLAGTRTRAKDAQDHVRSRLDRRLFDEEVDAHVDPPLADAAIRAGRDLDLVDPCALDVLDRLRGLLQAGLHGILDTLGRRAAEFDDLCNRHG